MDVSPAGRHAARRRRLHLARSKHAGRGLFRPLAGSESRSVPLGRAGRSAGRGGGGRRAGQRGGEPKRKGRERLFVLTHVWDVIRTMLAAIVRGGRPACVAACEAFKGREARASATFEVIWNSGRTSTGQTHTSHSGPQPSRTLAAPPRAPALARGPPRLFFDRVLAYAHCVCSVRTL